MTTHKIRGKGRNGKAKMLPYWPKALSTQVVYKSNFWASHTSLRLCCLAYPFAYPCWKWFWSIACRDFPGQCYSRLVYKNIQTAKLFFGQPIFLTLWNNSAHRVLFIVTKIQNERGEASIVGPPIGLI